MCFLRDVLLNIENTHMLADDEKQNQNKMMLMMTMMSLILVSVLWLYLFLVRCCQIKQCCFGKLSGYGILRSRMNIQVSRTLTMRMSILVLTLAMPGTRSTRTLFHGLSVVGKCC